MSNPDYEAWRDGLDTSGAETNAKGRRALRAARLRRAARRPALVLLRAFRGARTPIAWAEFLGGLSALVLTWPARVLPPFNDHPGNVLLTCVAWLLVAQEGYGQLQDALEDD